MLKLNKDMMKFGVIAALSLGGLGLLAGCQKPASDANAATEAAPRPAKVLQIVEQQGLYTRSFTGRVEAVQTVNMAFRVSGQLNELPVLESQRVKKGDLIAALDPTDYENILREAKVNYEQKKLDLQRYDELLKKQVISQGAFDKTRTAYDLAKVTLDKAEQNMGYTKLVAPFDAIITKRLVDNFTTVGQGNAVLRLQDVSEVQIDINVPETLFAQAINSDLRSMTAEFPANPGKAYQLTYREHSTEADPVTQTYRVTLAMPYPNDLSIFPGMTASVRIDARSPHVAGNDGILLPTSAIGMNPDKTSFVWIVNGTTNAISKRAVQLGQVLGPLVTISGGVDAGETIVVAGVAHLQDGQVIQPLGN
ncbi:efflux RND transporter periplasmic adaptor subunit [Polycladidibacter hongkongensis]|uniref:efflux RND transporter periplasmic adaptor subunit n=1 Tax=Polycladidibacter hongkongensis TaxID=1647556 RepID=UPI00082B4624|nr:efflux RND transporter periplasmic adaptor subunit [Pseudovibrio hongkongensis]